jgi:hypothetical protein
MRIFRCCLARSKSIARDLFWKSWQTFGDAILADIRDQLSALDGRILGLLDALKDRLPDLDWASLDGSDAGRSLSALLGGGVPDGDAPPLFDGAMAEIGRRDSLASAQTDFGSGMDAAEAYFRDIFAEDDPTPDATRLHPTPPRRSARNRAGRATSRRSG